MGAPSSRLANEEINSENAVMAFRVSPESSGFLSLFWIFFGVKFLCQLPETSLSRHRAWPFVPKLRCLWPALTSSCGMLPEVLPSFLLHLSLVQGTESSLHSRVNERAL